MQKIIAITAGGIGAKAAGGSFQSGAMSGAFVYLFNDCASGNCNWQKRDTAYPGNTEKIDGYRYFKLEPGNTNNIGPFGAADAFYYDARTFPLDSSGNPMAIVHHPDYGKGYTSHFDRIIDAGSQKHGNQLQININTKFQPTSDNSSSNGWYINVYTSK